ncbi:hypothetical protein [Aeromicrobium sp. 179-A 4D2 NHS]|uniref:hypothetical protein n=1 Tax=Aeromicrobium sp. 179-A 4D2 NHS TaxID=3142375 RepID=UPI00399F1087
MSEQATTGDIRGTLMGDKCSNCGMGYGQCTDRILNQGKGACCNSCYETDTHDERSVMVHENTIEGQWAMYADRAGLDANDNPVAKAAFEAAWTRATVIARNRLIEQD